MFYGKMTAGQEGKDRTEFLIQTVNLSKFSELESSCDETSTIIPQKNSNSFIFHILKGFYDQSILAKVKGVIPLAMNNPVEGPQVDY